MRREARERRSLGMLIAYGVNKPEELEKITPAERKRPQQERQEFEDERWWE